MSKYIELAKKLQALAERGVGGEQINAQKMLDDLMSKHSLSINDINTDAVRLHPFDFNKDEYSFKLLIQVMNAVLGIRRIKFKRPVNKKYTIVVECTESQSIEIEIKYALYWKAFKDEISILYDAFVERNYIYNPNITRDFAHYYDAQQQDKFARILNMKDSVISVEVHKSLESKNDSNKTN